MPKDSPMPLSMSDIARLAGVSESTVSRALNDSPLISGETRERIQKIARSMNYKFNESARNLRLKRSHTISVVINAEEGSGQSFSYPFLIDMITAIADELARHKYDLLYSRSIVNRTDWHSYSLGSRRADGVIVIGQGIDDSPLRELHRLGDPLVVWGGVQKPGADYCIVSSDNAMAGRQATGHLIGLGRRRIAFLGDVAHPEIEARYLGYRMALKDAGLEGRARHIGAAVSSESGYQCVADLLKRGDPGFDAIFAAGDHIAMGAIAGRGPSCAGGRGGSGFR